MTSQDLLKKVWRRPRWVMQNISTENMPLSLLLLLIYFAGVAYGFQRAELQDLGSQFDVSWIVGRIFLISGLSGLILYHLAFGLVNFIATRFFKGQGHYDRSRDAFVLSMIPCFFLVLLGVLSVILFGEKAFISAFWLGEQDFLSLTLGVIFDLLGLILSLWSIYIFLSTFAEAHQFSRWFAFFSAVIATLIIALPVVLIRLILMAV